MRRATFACAVAAALAFAAGPTQGAALPEVAIVTTEGTIVVALDPVHAPITTRHFLALVDAHAYAKHAEFYRIVTAADAPKRKFHVIQGGLGRHASGRTIPLERNAVTGLHNTNGTIAMARELAPDTATSEFFINVGKSAYLDSENKPDHNGYAVFGHVVRGMDVVLRIYGAPVKAEKLTPPIRIVRITRA